MASSQGDIWLAKLPNGEIRSGTRQQLEEAFQVGLLNEHMLVLVGGATEWVKLGTVMMRRPASEHPPAASRPSYPMPSAHASYPHPVAPFAAVTASAVPVPAAPAPVAAVSAAYAPAAVAVAPVSAMSATAAVHAPVTRSGAPAGGDASEANGLWQVRLASGQVRSGTREQLEEAVRAGHLERSASVLPPGTTAWLTLDAIAGSLVPARPAYVPAAAAATAPPAIQADAIAAPATQEPPRAEPARVEPEAPARAPARAQPEAPAQADAQTEPQPGVAPQEGGLPRPDTQPPPEAPAVAHPSPLWHVQVTYAQLRRALDTGLLADDALVRAAGTMDWLVLADVRREWPQSSEAEPSRGAEAPTRAQAGESS